MTLKKLYDELGDFLNMSEVAQQSGWNKATMSDYHTREVDMGSTRIRKQRLEAIIKTLKTLRGNLNSVIRYYERKL